MAAAVNRHSKKMNTAVRRLWINEDNAHFYDGHPSDEMTESGVRALVDRYADYGGAAGLLLCVNVQRALFDSRAWEPLYADYQPDGPDDQPCLAWLPPEARAMTPDRRGRHWVHNLWLLRARGVDHPAVWLDQCRRRGIAGWLSMRMNDCHHNDAPDAFWHSTLWKTRPDLRRAGARDGDWFEGAFDYGQSEVVAHHLALVRELCERYDFDGLELDWVRWVRHFRPGGEQAGRSALTGFMREARRLTAAAGARRGRPVQLGVRLPSDPAVCLQWGYDILAWAREGLADQIALAPFFQQAEYEWPVELWRAIFGPSARLLCQSESAFRPYPDIGASDLLLDYAFLFGSASSAFERGADGIYLFNECYRMAPDDRIARENPGLLEILFGRLADRAALREMHRRHPAGYAQIVGPGAADGAPLPAPLTKPDGHWSFNRHGRIIALRICLGGGPARQPLRLELGFDTPLAASELRVWLNGRPLAADLEPGGLLRPRAATTVLAFGVPREIANDDVNIVELLPPPRAPGRVVWAELVVGAREGAQGK